MPHFKKKENELLTRLDKWLYFIKHLEDFQTIPEIFKAIFLLKHLPKLKLQNTLRKKKMNTNKALKFSGI